MKENFEFKMLPSFFLDRMVREALQLPDPIIPKRIPRRNEGVFVSSGVRLETENLSVIEEPTAAEVLRFA